jgi:hypothetical protein
MGNYLPIIELTDGQLREQTRFISRQRQCVVLVGPLLRPKPHELRDLINSAGVKHLILTRKVTDFEFLYNSSGLWTLQVRALQERELRLPDFPFLKHLKIILGKAQPVTNGIILSESLELSFYKPKTRDLSLFGPMPNLVSLKLHQGSLISLYGLEADKLRQLRLSMMRYLGDLNVSRVTKDSILRLEVNSCGNVPDLSSIDRFGSLLRLEIVKSKFPVDLRQVNNKIKHLRIDSVECAKVSFPALVDLGEIEYLYIKPWPQQANVYLQTLCRSNGRVIDTTGFARPWPDDAVGAYNVFNMVN